MKEKTVRIGNRLSGLAMTIFGGMFFASGAPLALDTLAALFVIEGLGDAISGDHHYVSSNVASYLSKGRIKFIYQFDRYKR